jgi:hypothetical protein
MASDVAAPLMLMFFDVVSNDPVKQSVDAPKTTTAKPSTALSNQTLDPAATAVGTSSRNWKQRENKMISAIGRRTPCVRNGGEVWPACRGTDSLENFYLRKCIAFDLTLDSGRGTPFCIDYTRKRRGKIFKSPPKMFNLFTFFYSYCKFGQVLNIIWYITYWAV